MVLRNASESVSKQGSDILASLSQCEGDIDQRLATIENYCYQQLNVGRRKKRRKPTFEWSRWKINLVEGDNRMVTSEAEQGVTGSGSQEKYW